jgi:hypothetical protein
MKPTKVMVLVVAFVVLVLSLASSAQRVETGAAATGRFQLISSQVFYQDSSSVQGGALPGPGLFLLDSQTGRVWSYQELTVLKNKEGKITGTNPEQFFPVNVVETSSRQ